MVSGPFESLIVLPLAKVVGIPYVDAARAGVGEPAAQAEGITPCQVVARTLDRDRSEGGVCREVVGRGLVPEERAGKTMESPEEGTSAVAVSA